MKKPTLAELKKLRTAVNNARNRYFEIRAMARCSIGVWRSLASTGTIADKAAVKDNKRAVIKFVLADRKEYFAAKQRLNAALTLRNG